jgi:hypothetical protein
LPFERVQILLNMILKAPKCTVHYLMINYWYKMICIWLFWITQRHRTTRSYSFEKIIAALNFVQ